MKIATLIASAVMVSLSLGIGGGAMAQVGDTVRLGVLTDMIGANAAWAGKGSVVATELAIADFKAAHPDLPYKIEVQSADFQLKSDVAVAISRKWAADGVNAIIDIPYSAAALAVKDALKGSPVALLMTGPQHDDLTTKECASNMVHWVLDVSAISLPPLRGMVKGGEKRWFLITVDGAGGTNAEEPIRRVVTEEGGTVLGSVRNPINAPDFSSYLLQAQAAKPDVIVLIQTGADFVTALKQAEEFGLRDGKIRIHVPNPKITDIYGFGLPLAKGLRYADAFYHDADDKKRAFSKRFADKMGGQVPSSNQAGVYSVVMHYLNSVQEAKTTNGDAVVAKMKQLPVTDPVLGPGKVRMDGRMVHDMYMLDVKTPAESKGPWDLAKVVRVIPGDDAFRPMSKACPLVK
ncbi:ABC transporter substrate-binding protein [soil metagenome]